MQNAEGTVPAEYNDEDYFREVLQLDEGQTEVLFDEKLAQEAEKLGITISRPPTPKAQNLNHNSICESALTEVSRHVRTASSGSQRSASTSMTSRSSNDQLDNSAPMHSRKRPISRRSLSFSEYEKYLAQHEAQEAMKTGVVPPPMPSEPAPSLFSVSTRRSYVSIRNGLKHRFRLRRNKSFQEELK
jgi:cell pole-organizing protein PopZ